MVLKIILLLIFVNFVASQQSSTKTEDILISDGNETTTATPHTSPTVTTIEPTNATTTTPTPTTGEPPTLPPPTLPPSPTTSSWNVTHPNGSVCILAEFAAQIKIKYNSTEKDNKQLTTGFNIPADASVDRNASVCSNGTQVLELKFDIENQTTGSIRFAFNKSSDKVFVQSLTIVYQLTENLFPNYINRSEYNKTITVENDVSNLFTVDDSHSYRCKPQSSVTLDNTEPDLQTYGAELDISDVKVQAYIQSDAKSNGTYSAEQNCETSKVSDVVPIAVGASLAALVIIVLIAYFVGRRRSRRLAYHDNNNKRV